MIRQAISCDVCGRDKQQTSHWFVVYEHGSELRISGWSSQVRMSAKAKHLCGQTCLHKLIDEYLARTLAAAFSAAKPETASEEKKLPVSIDENRPAIPAQSRTDASLTSAAAHAQPVPAAPAPETYVDDYESSARLIPSQDAIADPEVEPIPNAPSFNSLAWRTEAWKREREREQRNPARSRRSSLL